MVRLFHRLLPMALATSAVVACSPVSAGTFEPNVRPFAHAEFTRPVEYADLDRGFGAGFGFEVEHSRLASLVVRASWATLERNSVEWFSSGVAYAAHDRRQLLTLAMGARFHARTRKDWRPYAEADWGIRITEKDGRAVTTPLGFFDAPPRERQSANGMIAGLNVGLSTARSREGGAFVEAGFEFRPTARDVSYAIVPIRVGIVFP